MKDHECLSGWRRHQRAQALRPLLERHGPLVFSCAQKRLGNPESAAEVTRAAFLVMARRRRKAAKLDRWLLKITLIACRKLKRRSFSWLRERFERKLAPKEILSLPPGLADEILSAIETTGRNRPKEKLARSVLRTLFWTRWAKRAAIAQLVIIVAGAAVVAIEAPRGFSGIMAQLIVWPTRYEVWKYSEEVHPWTGTLQATNISDPADLYRATNIWPVHLAFTRAQWNALAPRKIETLPNFITSDGKILVRNPKAPRSGFAGVLGYAFDWSSGDLEFAGARFDHVAVRIKGNVGALIEPKRPFKIDLNRLPQGQGQKLAGLDELTFNNLMWDPSRRPRL